MSGRRLFICRFRFRVQLYRKDRRGKALVCITSEIPPNVIQRDDGWKALRIQGVLEFSLIGILSKIAAILAVSTYNTDYLLTKKENYEKVIKALKNAGYKILE